MKRIALKIVGPFVTDTTKRAKSENFEQWIIESSMNLSKYFLIFLYTLKLHLLNFPLSVVSSCYDFADNDGESCCSYYY